MPFPIAVPRLLMPLLTVGLMPVMGIKSMMFCGVSMKGTTLSIPAPSTLGLYWLVGWKPWLKVPEPNPPEPYPPPWPPPPPYPPLPPSLPLSMLLVATAPPAAPGTEALPGLVPTPETVAVAAVGLGTTVWAALVTGLTGETWPVLEVAVEEPVLTCETWPVVEAAASDVPGLTWLLLEAASGVPELTWPVLEAASPDPGVTCETWAVLVDSASEVPGRPPPPKP